MRHFRLKKVRYSIKLFLVLLLSLTGAVTRGQSTNTQLWFEHLLNYPFANVFNLENAFVYSTLRQSPRWYAFDYSPTLEYALGKHFDATVGVTLSYTAQTQNFNTVEIRPVLGTRIHITPERRVLTRIYLRLEQRNFLNLDTRAWERVLRPRIRAESIIPVNKESYYHDGLWYGIADIEWLFSAQDVEERFANRFRARMGIGYRLSYSSRFEFIYMIQQSRNGIDEDFSSSDNIFRFRYKLYLNKAKPTKLSGSGN